MANPLDRSIGSALRANDRIAELFAKMGTTDHPRGSVMTAYRNAVRAMKSALREPKPISSAGEVMANLRVVLASDVKHLLTLSQETGMDEAARQLRFYGIEAREQRFVPMELGIQADSAVSAILARHDAQARVVEAMLLMGNDPARIIGDENRQGVLRPGDVLAATAFWIAALAWDAWTHIVSRNARDGGFMKQAVAALDNRTTECCLRAHGQVRPLDGKFHLTGEPRYADDIDWPPFHGYCRTSVALYREEYDEGLTDRMRAGANKILDERARGVRRERYPVDAFGGE